MNTLRRRIRLGVLSGITADHAVTGVSANDVRRVCARAALETVQQRGHRDQRGTTSHVGPICIGTTSDTSHTTAAFTATSAGEQPDRGVIIRRRVHAQIQSCSFFPRAASVPGPSSAPSTELGDVKRNWKPKLAVTPTTTC